MKILIKNAVSMDLGSGITRYKRGDSIIIDDRYAIEKNLVATLSDKRFANLIKIHSYPVEITTEKPKKKSKKKKDVVEDIEGVEDIENTTPFEVREVYKADCDTCPK